MKYTDIFETVEPLTAENYMNYLPPVISLGQRSSEINVGLTAVYGSIGNGALSAVIELPQFAITPQYGYLSKNLMKLKDFVTYYKNPGIDTQTLLNDFYILPVPDYGNQSMSIYYMDFFPYVYDSGGYKICQNRVCILREFSSQQAFILVDKSLENNGNAKLENVDEFTIQIRRKLRSSNTIEKIIDLGITSETIGTDKKYFETNIEISKLNQLLSSPEDYRIMIGSSGNILYNSYVLYNIEIDTSSLNNIKSLQTGDILLTTDDTYVTLDYYRQIYRINNGDTNTIKQECYSNEVNIRLFIPFKVNPETAIYLIHNANKGINTSLENTTNKNDYDIFKNIKNGTGIRLFNISQMGTNTNLPHEYEVIPKFRYCPNITISYNEEGSPNISEILSARGISDSNFTQAIFYDNSGLFVGHSEELTYVPENNITMICYFSIEDGVNDLSANSPKTFNTLVPTTEHSLYTRITDRLSLFDPFLFVNDHITPNDTDGENVILYDSAKTILHTTSSSVIDEPYFSGYLYDIDIDTSRNNLRIQNPDSKKLSLKDPEHGLRLSTENESAAGNFYRRKFIDFSDTVKTRPEEKLLSKIRQQLFESSHKITVYENNSGDSNLELDISTYKYRAYEIEYLLNDGDPILPDHGKFIIYTLNGNGNLVDTMVTDEPDSVRGGHFLIKNDIENQYDDTIILGYYSVFDSDKNDENLESSANTNDFKPYFTYTGENPISKQDNDNTNINNILTINGDFNCTADPVCYPTCLDGVFTISDTPFNIDKTSISYMFIPLNPSDIVKLYIHPAPIRVLGII